MYKNQLQELAQRSCFNLPSYTCIREGPDHAPRFKATVNFNGEIFESPNYCSTLRQAEHAAAEVALNSLSNSGPSHSLAARILDETGVYKNLLQEIAQRVGAPLPQYTTYRAGLGHLPVFTGTVELAGITFTGEPAKNKKQAEKNAAMAAWSSLKQLAKETASSSSEAENSDELEQVTIARALLNYCLKEKMAMTNSSNGPSRFPQKFPIQSPRLTSPQPPAAATSRILPLICPKTPPRTRPASPVANERHLASTQIPLSEHSTRPQKFPGAGAAPYVPIRQYRPPCRGVALPVTIRTAVPVFSAPQLPPPSSTIPPVLRAQPVQIAPPVCVRQVVPVFAAPPAPKQEPPKSSTVAPPVCIRPAVPAFAAPPAPKEPPRASAFASPVCIRQAVPVLAAPAPNNLPEETSVSPPVKAPSQMEEAEKQKEKGLQESDLGNEQHDSVVKILKELEI
ncbi:Double-stranded RNA-binding domain [Dillenia turbinata]|uniref:Double-stranded RNA-binding domain n=1 Tax=Dillenia turbinata TaxID=194707 RepID=A0AAN8Z6K3_9MAGN